MKVNNIEKQRNVALIIAGGVGARTTYKTPKQFITINDKPIIIYTLEAFENNPSIDEVVIVTLKEWEEILINYLVQFNIKKVKWITYGGSTGQESIKNGVDLLKQKYAPNDVILIHDAVRPLLNDDVINANIASVIQNGTAVTVVPATEALLYSEDLMTSNKLIDRSKILRTQTPQSLRLSKLVDIHERAKEQGITNSVATCTLLIELGETIHTVQGTNENFKITTKEDIDLLEAYLNDQNKGKEDRDRYYVK